MSKLVNTLNGLRKQPAHFISWYIGRILGAVKDRDEKKVSLLPADVIVPVRSERSASRRHPDVLFARQ